MTSYAYDSMGRLTGEELDGETACYSYDHAGNRLTRTGAGRTEHYRYNSRNQLTELDSTAGTVRYEYDPAGSLTAEVRTAQGGSATECTGYTYDAYNRNTSVCGAGYVQQNHYDAEGLRYAVTENGETTNFVYRNGMPVSELDADKNPVRGYILGNEYISQSDGTSFGYYLNDEQGSVRYLTGSDGSIRNHYRYSAFGETITAEETVPNRLRYNGQMADGLTGLYYLRARYYNASLGRFTQEDVIYNDGLNLYAYCNSNPVMYSDPSGFAKDSVPFNMRRYNYPDINAIDYNRILREYVGEPPSDMFDPHAHHILFKKGRGRKQQELTQKAQQILAENYRIDPIKGKEVLCWAPNRVEGQHTTETLQSLVDDIVEVDNHAGSHEEMIEVLDRHKEQAQKRGTTCAKKGG